jgi:hypothetical protein
MTRQERQMSSPNGSIANLSVTRKTLGASIDNNAKAGVLFNLRLSHRLQVLRSEPASDGCEALREDQNEKAGASTAPASAGTIIFAAWRLSSRYFWMLA